MTGPITTQREQGLSVGPLAARNRAAVVELSKVAWERSRSTAATAWRYDACPTLEGAVALHESKCVACVFAMRRSYWSPDGEREILEPFDWYTTEDWRPKGAGLRVMKHLMSGPLPLIAMGGSEGGRKLLTRLGWKHVWTATRLALPLTGRYLALRGWAKSVAVGFDLFLRGYYRPLRPGRSELRVEPAAVPGPALDTIIRSQRRFSLVPRSSPAVLSWLRNAPPEMGLYLGFNLVVGDEMVGWAWARVVTAGLVRYGDLQDLILADEARQLYPAAVRKVVWALAGFGVDAVIATSTCPDTLAALRQNRFRLDYDIPLYTWWPGHEPPPTALVTNSHAEHAFFPGPTARDAAWATAER